MNYLLLGSEGYNLRARRNEIIKKSIGDINDPLAVSIYRGQDGQTIQEVLDDCATSPFLNDKKVVIYEDPPFIMEGKISDKDLQLLEQYLNNPSEFTDLIFYSQTSLNKNSVVIKNLAKYMKYESFNQLSSDEFATFVKKDINERKLNITNDGINALIERLPISVNNWKSELEKLALYPEKLTKEAVINLISKPIEDNAFELTNALMNKDLAKALSVYNDLLLNNKNDIPALVGLLASQFRFMSQVKILQENNVNQSDIASQLAANPYRIKMTLKACGNKTSYDVLAILNQLSNLDIDIKTNKVNPQSALELFIIKCIGK